MEAELSDSGAKDTFPPDLRIKIFEDDFAVIGWVLIINVLEFSVEGILNHIVLFFRRGVCTIRLIFKILPLCGLWLFFRSQA